ncbi:MAG: EVE domain-containing protein [Planctomycetes bacterium]|nr:EVE domain-containing protein [Planctomycetota bacterium]
MGEKRAQPAAKRRYWLLKTEPSSFAFEDLLRAPKRRTQWDGVRNYQARNFMRDDMQFGDLALIYHSSADPTGITGIARIVRAARPDATQFDPKDEHFDPKARREDPPWVAVEIEALVPVEPCVSLQARKDEPRLAQMLVLRRGQRLSVQPVESGEWQVVLELAGLDPGNF